MSQPFLALRLIFVLSVLGPIGHTAGEPQHPPNAVRQRLVVVDASVTFNLDLGFFESQRATLVPHGHVEQESSAGRVTFGTLPSATFTIEAQNGTFSKPLSGCMRTKGALLIDREGEDRLVIGNLAVEVGPHGELAVNSTLHEEDAPAAVFDVESAMFELTGGGHQLRIVAELVVSQSWADKLGVPTAAGRTIGTLVVQAELADEVALSPRATSCDAAATLENAGRSSASNVSDVIVAELQSVRRYGADGRITAFAIGTTACNIGTARANWIAVTNNHPVIVQNLYRLKNERFEQIGLSWVKHGFYAVSESLCSPCNDPVDGGQQLGVGCSDPYSALLNASQSNVSPRSHVNAHTGYFPFPWHGPPVGSTIERRLQVDNTDLDPVFNPGARYFIQGHYVMADDAAAGTNDNNASYRRVQNENPSSGVYELEINPSWSTQRGQPAVRAWQDTDSTVVETDVRVPGEGLFILAAKAFEKQPGIWAYSYALQNLNSDRSARTFEVPVPADALIANIGFHDVHYHSGDPYDGTDWDVLLSDDSIKWFTDPYVENENANALRFGTVYSFYFESDIEPVPTTIEVELFKPGPVPSVTAESVGPKLLRIDCNDNNISDTCDLDCDALQCTAPCGESADCNADGIPDECQQDCDDDGVPDDCEIMNCPPGDLSCGDCNFNGVPDGCEPDCDGDGLPDDCGVPLDTDEDGVLDCFDACRYTTVNYKCDCPALIECCWGVVCVSYPYVNCLEDGGTPDCLESPCREGCLLGDWDGDGRVRLADVCQMQLCFSGGVGGPGYIEPPADCLMVFDSDDDGDVDVIDYAVYGNLLKE